MTTVFISYAKEDAAHARQLYRSLGQQGVDAWLDEESLLPGQKWRERIESAIARCRYFIAIISSRSVSKKGYVQKELKTALDILDQYPENDIFVIPVRIETCEIIERRLTELHYVDLFPEYEPGFAKLLAAIGRPLGKDLGRSPRPRRVDADATADHLTAAEQFFGEFDKELEERKRQESERTAEQAGISRKLKTLFSDLERDAGAMIAAFNTAGRSLSLSLTATPFPENVFAEPGTYRMLVSFGGTAYWLFRFVTYPDGTLAMRLVRVYGKPGADVMADFRLTNDSLNFVLFGEEFGLSLNRQMTPDAVSDIVGDVSKQRRPLDELVSTAALLLRRAIQRELLLGAQ